MNLTKFITDKKYIIEVIFSDGSYGYFGDNPTIFHKPTLFNDVNYANKYTLEKASKIALKISNHSIILDKGYSEKSFYCNTKPIEHLDYWRITKKEVK